MKLAVSRYERGAGRVFGSPSCASGLRRVGARVLGTPWPRRAVTVTGLGADSFALSPLLLFQQHGAELAEPFGAVDEHLEDLVAVGKISSASTLVSRS